MQRSPCQPWKHVHTPVSHTPPTVIVLGLVGGWRSKSGGRTGSAPPPPHAAVPSRPLPMLGRVANRVAEAVRPMLLEVERGAAYERPSRWNLHLSLSSSSRYSMSIGTEIKLLVLVVAAALDGRVAAAAVLLALLALAALLALLAALLALLALLARYLFSAPCPPCE